MLDTSEMIIASLSKVWHLIPIIILIILFKKFINSKDKKHRMSINEENEQKGLTLKSRTVKKYEDLGYKIISQESQENEKDQSIDLICTKDDKILLIQCENTSKSKSITSEDIKKFHKKAINYLEKNKIKQSKAEFRYVVAYSDVLDKSAIKILKKMIILANM